MRFDDDFRCQVFGPLIVSLPVDIGLSRGFCHRLARTGCIEQEIMSMTGHKTSKEIARYTKSANQKARAERAIDKMSSKK